MSSLLVISSSLNQMPLAWQSNADNIIASAATAVRSGRSFRPGVEFELCGVFCGVHLHDVDFNDRVWKSLVRIVDSGVSDHVVVEVGTAFHYEGAVYSCLVTLHKGQILFFRPANTVSVGPSHPSNRFISPWQPRSKVQFVQIPSAAGEFYNSGKKIPIGNYFLDLGGHTIYSIFQAEVGSDLWNRAVKAKADLVAIGYSHAFELHKVDRFLETLAKNSDHTTFVVNSIAGSESPKTVFEGGSWVVAGRRVHQLIDHLSLERNQHAEFLLTLDLQKRRKSESASWIPIHLKVDSDELHLNLEAQEPKETEQNGEVAGESAQPPTEPALGAPKISHPDHSELKIFEPLSDEETLITAMSTYLFHTLVETNACGFFLALSGGADSSLILSTVHFLAERIAKGSPSVKAAAKKLLGKLEADLDDPKSITAALIHVAYLPMHFSGATKRVAQELAKGVGCELLELPIENIFQSFRDTVEKKLDITADFTRENDSASAENLALQNLQARIRLVLSYYTAQLLHKKIPLRSYLLMLGTGNGSEVARGYYTKYDNSSGDINVVGSLQKTEILSILRFLSKRWPHIPALADIAAQPPSAELVPPKDGQGVQTDEADMGLSYPELDFLTQKVRGESLWGDSLVAAYQQEFPHHNAEEVVKKFLRNFQRNRHKVLTLPPSVHLTRLDLDGQFDTRPTMYKEDGLLGKRPTL